MLGNYRVLNLQWGLSVAIPDEYCPAIDILRINYVQFWIDWVTRFGKGCECIHPISGHVLYCVLQSWTIRGCYCIKSYSKVGHRGQLLKSRTWPFGVKIEFPSPMEKVLETFHSDQVSISRYLSPARLVRPNTTLAAGTCSLISGVQKSWDSKFFTSWIDGRFACDTRLSPCIYFLTEAR